MDTLTTCPDRICEEHRGFVQWVIKTYFPGYCYDDDFLQEGWIGLWEATKSFDESRGVKFKSFASVIIRRRCCDELKRRRRHSDHKVFSLDETYKDSSTPYIENVPCQKDEIALVTSKIAAGQLLEEIRLSGLTERQLNIMSCRIEGQTMKQISKNVGVCTSSVYDGLKAIKQAAKVLAEKY